MPTNSHLISGLPAWATDEEATEAAAAIGAQECAVEEGAPASNYRVNWALAARYYWAAAYIALSERNFPLMRGSTTLA